MALFCIIIIFVIIIQLPHFSDDILIDTSIEIIAILRHYFKLGLKATESTHRSQ